MENKVNLTLVGAFVITLTVAMIASGLWLASGSYQRKSYDSYETYMTESVAGLNVNAAVRYRGVDVGRVRRIMLAPGNVEQVRVMLDIERGTPVKTDTVATLQTQGLTGIGFVELSGGRKDSPALQASAGQDVPVIASGPSLLERLETAAPLLMANMSRAVDSLNAVLDEPNRRALGSTINGLSLITQTLAGRSVAIDATLANSARVTEQAARVTEQAARFGAQLPQMVQRYERAADALERMATDISATSADTRRTLADANGTFDVARQVITDARGDVAQFTGATLAEARELVTELRGMTATMHRVAEELERNPAALLQGRKPSRRGPGE